MRPSSRSSCSARRPHARKEERSRRAEAALIVVASLEWRAMKHLPRDQQKELADHARLMRAWKAWHREQLDEALAGPHGALDFRIDDPARPARARAPPRRCSTSSGAAIGAPSATTPGSPCCIEINDRITRMRECHGLPPFDDPLPGQPDNVFRIVRAILTPSPAHERRLSPSVATERTGRDVTAAVQMKE